MTTCSECEGRKVVACATCDGKGDMYFVPVLDIWEADCGECYGSGVTACPLCNGLGYVAVAPHPPAEMRYLSHP